MDPASETISGVDVVQFLTYLLPGYLTVWFWRKLTAPPEYRATETEVVGSWLIGSIPSLILTVKILQLAWGPDVRLENLKHFLRSPGMFGIYVCATAISALVVAVAADMARLPLFVLANRYRTWRQRTPMGQSPSVWAQLAAENVRTETELVLPDGRRLRGEIAAMNDGESRRELLVVNCTGTCEGWTGDVPEAVYVNVETGQMIPIWRDKVPHAGPNTGAPPGDGERTGPSASHNASAPSMTLGRFPG